MVRLSSVQAEDESFAEFIKDRTKSGGSFETPTAAPAAPTPAVTPIAAATIYAAPITVAPKSVAAPPPPAITPFVDSPLIPVNASTIIIPTSVEADVLSAATPATLPVSDPAPVYAAATSSLASPPVIAKSAQEQEGKGSGDFTEYLDKVVAQTKKTIEETAVTNAKHPEGG